VTSYLSLADSVVAVKDGCWEWQGSINSHGYGQWTRGGRAYKVLFEMIRFKVAKDLQLDHLCRNKLCVNPAHLEPVTPRENQHRSPITLATKNSSKTHCPYGHEYNEVNTYNRPNGKGRKCRVCNKLNERKRGLPKHTLS